MTTLVHTALINILYLRLENTQSKGRITENNNTIDLISNAGSKKKMVLFSPASPRNFHETFPPPPPTSSMSPHWAFFFVHLKSGTNIALKARNLCSILGNQQDKPTYPFQYDVLLLFSIANTDVVMNIGDFYWKTLYC